MGNRAVDMADSSDLMLKASRWAVLSVAAQLVKAVLLFGSQVVLAPTRVGPVPVSARTATLAAFNGLNPNGDWTIFFRDASLVDVSTLNGWSVGVTPVPEPVNLALGVSAGLLLAVGLWRAWRLRCKA